MHTVMSLTCTFWKLERTAFPFQPQSLAVVILWCSILLSRPPHFKQSFLQKRAPIADTLGSLPLKTSNGSALTFQGIMSNVREIAAEYFMRTRTRCRYPSAA